MGFLEFLATGAAPDTAPHDEMPADAQHWSDQDTWGGRVPAKGESVTIAAGRTLLIDQDIEVGSLYVKGTLLVARADIHISAEWILVEGRGALTAGTVDRPHKQQLRITLCSGPAESRAPAHPLLGSKFLAALDGGTIDLHGQARTSWVPLGASTVPGHNTLRLSQPVDWRAGESIAIASGANHSLLEERTISDMGADCLTVRLASALRHRHHGQQAPLRHAVPGSIGKVVLLSRNIVVEGCDDSERDSVGAYCVIARTSDRASPSQHSIGRFSGVEFRRMGQFNRPGRYPLHWHNNGDAADSSVVGCLIHQSYQRGIVAVGSPHVRISGNVVVKPFGHGYIVESEDNSPQLITT
ncbi:MAG: G8 domain-containing protein, partial [Burkholderiaceae bacterium]|nr:G8 domain-containing protein [Burkholderiaceae bacterium]